jgi:uncharacterized membrane protein
MLRSLFPEREDGKGLKGTGDRFWEVDFARGVAIIMVVVYHLVFDLDNFAGYPVASTSGFWGVFADVSAFAFVFLAGVSLQISGARASAAGPRRFGKFLRRGLRILGWGMLVTLVFWALDFGYVVFGILHLIGLSIILAHPFMKLRFFNVLFGLLFIAAGSYVSSQGFVASGAAGVFLAPLGVIPEGLYMPDYRPLLPWFGVVLLGLFFGKIVYADRKRKPSARPRLAAPVEFLGRHTLFIYLIHQPILISTLWMLGVISF